MDKKIFTIPFFLCGLLFLEACTTSTATTDEDDDADVAELGCTLTDNTTETETVNDYGCNLLTRDTSSCEDERTAQGLSGFWLKFSCRVDLTVSGENVIITTDSQPDYKNFYFEEDDDCFEDADLDGRFANPNTTAEQTIVVTVPLEAETTENSAVEGGTIGVALNGVSIFSNQAAPGDDIYEESQTFDLCDGHPQNTGNYHYHVEPSSISNQDENFIGVMRDGFPIYGRSGHGSSEDVTDLDEAGGHTSVTVDSPETPVYHYHVNVQTNGTDSEYFISAGFWAGDIGTCTGCQ